MARGPAPSIYTFLAASVIAVTTAAAPAIADESPEPIQIIFSAPPQCPSLNVFERELKGRTRRPWIRGGRESSRTVRIAITSREDLFRGRLIIEEPSASSRSDEVTWESCDDVVSALAVKAAITLDRAPPRSMPTLGPPMPPSLFWEGPRWIFSAAGVRIDHRPQPWRVTGGFSLTAIGAISPGLTPAPSVFLDVSRIGEGLEAITVRLSILRAIDSFKANQAVVTMQWVASRLEACPLHRRFPPFTLSPCLAVDTGAVEWKISPSPLGTPRHWIALDLIGRVQVALFERLVLELQAGMILPLTRYEFGLGEERLSGKSLHKVPVVSGMIGGATGVRFP